MTRLRPVLMTSAATVFGHLPLVLVSGPGGGGAEQHRYGAGHGHDGRHAVYAVRGAGVLFVDRHSPPTGRGVGPARNRVCKPRGKG